MQPIVQHWCRCRGDQWSLTILVVQVLLQVEGVSMLLGVWWMEAARRGGPGLIPLVNRSPREWASLLSGTKVVAMLKFLLEQTLSLTCVGDWFVFPNKKLYIYIYIKIYIFQKPTNTVIIVFYCLNR